MNQTLKLMCILSLLVQGACSAVFVAEPLGDTVVILNPDEWQATWLSDEVVVTTTVLDADKGLIQAAWIERRPAGAELETTEAYLRSSGDILYGNVKDVNEQGETRYVWLRINKSPRRLTFFKPDIEQFQSLIEAGQFPGKVIEDGIVLGTLIAQHIKMINSPSSQLLEWEDPVVFIRIAD